MTFKSTDGNGIKKLTNIPTETLRKANSTVVIRNLTGIHRKSEFTDTKPRAVKRVWIKEQTSNLQGIKLIRLAVRKQLLVEVEPSKPICYM
jgi:hypothetical protein